MQDPVPSPEFMAAANAYDSLRAQGLERSPAGLAAWQSVIEYAPPVLLEAIHAKAVELNLIPKKPDGYTAEGEPVYRLEEIARRAGLSVEEAEASIQEFNMATGAKDIDPSRVYRTQ